MPAAPVQVATIHSAIVAFWSDLERAIDTPPDSRWRVQFETAAAEIAGNIAEHAHPHNAGAHSMRLRLLAYPDYIEARFTDRGVPYDPPDEPRITDLPFATALDPLDLDALDLLEIGESGRGLAISRAAVDRLEYRRTSSGMNAWRIIKHFQPRAS